MSPLPALVVVVSSAILGPVIVLQMFRYCCATRRVQSRARRSLEVTLAIE
jgi:hypothetical protein